MNELIKKQAGRPPRYRRKFDALAYEMALMGATDAQLASILNISVETLRAWKKQHKTFARHLQKGKDIADSKVAEALYRKAVGYYYDEVSYELDKLSMREVTQLNIKDDLFRKKVTTKHVAPDVNAIALWLRIRQPKLWRDTSALELVKVLGQLPEDQLNKIIASLQQQIKDEPKQIE